MPKKDIMIIKIPFLQTLLCYLTLNSVKMTANATSSVSQQFTSTTSGAIVFLPNITTFSSNVSSEVSMPPSKTILGTTNSYTTTVNVAFHISTPINSTTIPPTAFISTVKSNALTKKHEFRINNAGKIIDRQSRRFSLCFLISQDLKSRIFNILLFFSRNHYYRIACC